MTDPIAAACREAILRETGYRPAARDLTSEQCRRIADAVLEAAGHKRWPYCPHCGNGVLQEHVPGCPAASAVTP